MRSEEPERAGPGLEPALVSVGELAPTEERYGEEIHGAATAAAALVPVAPPVVREVGAGGPSTLPRPALAAGRATERPDARRPERQARRRPGRPPRASGSPAGAATSGQRPPLLLARVEECTERLGTDPEFGADPERLEPLLTHQPAHHLHVHREKVRHVIEGQEPGGFPLLDPRWTLQEQPGGLLEGHCNIRGEPRGARGGPRNSLHYPRGPTSNPTVGGRFPPGALTTPPCPRCQVQEEDCSIRSPSVGLLGRGQ